MCNECHNMCKMLYHPELYAALSEAEQVKDGDKLLIVATIVLAALSAWAMWLAR